MLVCTGALKLVLIPSIALAVATTAVAQQKVTASADISLLPTALIQRVNIVAGDYFHSNTNTDLGT